MDSIIIPPRRQKVWSWPAVALFTLGGMGAGLYLSSFILTLMAGGVHLFTQRPLAYGLVACLALVFGFIFILGEAGKPLKGYYAAFNLKTSWLSREVLSVLILITSVLVDNINPSVFFRIVSVGSAIFFLLCQGYVVSSSRAISAWNIKIVPLFFLLSGISSGYGLLLLVIEVYHQTMTGRLVIFGLALLTANLMVLIAYVFPDRGTEFRQATNKLRKIPYLFFNFGLGGVLPLILLSISFYPVESSKAGLVDIGSISIATGLTIVFGAISHKTSILITAAFTRGSIIKIDEH